MDAVEKRPDDKFEALAMAASFALVLLANESTGDWELVKPEPVLADMDRTYKERNLSFAGCLGIVAGKPRVALAMPLEDAVLDDITREFLRRFERLITHPVWTMQPDRKAN